jgi:hypothetical protein
VTAVVLFTGCQPTPQAVTTYHYDNKRTGWNSNETTIDASNVGRLDVQHVVSLDDQVDAQPLVVPGLASIGNLGTGGHDVVYVATENNSVYAIDVVSGVVLAQRNLGAPVPTPLNCPNNGPNVGIDSTPVIDTGTNTMYLITYGLEDQVPVHRLHALDITTLTDRMPPVQVVASHVLTNGDFAAFDSRFERQRAGLLIANGNIYAGFASYCDFEQGRSRGWILGWQEKTLSPLPANELTNQLAFSPDQFFLSGVWMSGYGLAADSEGFIYAVTGNSDLCHTPPSTTNTCGPSGSTYGNSNFSETVVKLKPDLTGLVDLFTPSNVADLDFNDTDFGAGGALIVPDQNGPVPHMVAAAGKDGRLFVLNADKLGGFTPGGPDNDLTEQDIGGCWCGQSFYQDAGAGGVIVSSGGANVTLWRIQTSPTVTLISNGSSRQLFVPTPNGPDPGFFTTVSSAGAGPGVIIWAVSRPNFGATGVRLFAFSDATDSTGQLTLLRTLPGGIWPFPGANANIVPVVANGRVFVASYEMLMIFGLQ